MGAHKYILDADAWVYFTQTTNNAHKVAFVDACNNGEICICSVTKGLLESMNKFFANEIKRLGCAIIYNKNNDDFECAAGIEMQVPELQELGTAQREQYCLMLAKAQRLALTIVSGQSAVYGISVLAVCNRLKIPGTNCAGFTNGAL